MRHMKKGSKLNRTASHRRALMSNLITGLIVHEKIRTTKAKAKQVRPLAEKMITFAKRGDLHARRQVLRLIKDKDAVAKLFDTLGARFKDRPGGYTRILKMQNRNGDNAEMALLELVAEDVKGGGRKRRRRSKKQAAPEAAAQAQQTVAAEEKTAEAEANAVEEQAPEAEAAAETEAPAVEEPQAEAETTAEEEKKD